MKKVMLEPSVTAEIFSYLVNMFRPFKPIITYGRTPLTRIVNYPDRLGPSGKFVDNSAKLTCLEITGHWIKYSTVLRPQELQIRRGRKV